MIASLFALHRYPWTMLKSIGDFIRQQGQMLSDEQYEQLGSDVWVARSAKIWDYVTILGPTTLERERRSVRVLSYAAMLMSVRTP